MLTMWVSRKIDGFLLNGLSRSRKRMDNTLSGFDRVPVKQKDAILQRPL